MPHLFGEAGGQGMRDVSHLALPESHQGTGCDAGIQGAAHDVLSPGQAQVSFENGMMTSQFGMIGFLGS